jgi:hypothetical protein
MTRTEFVRQAAVHLMRTTHDVNARITEARSAKANAEALADEFGLVDEPALAQVGVLDEIAALQGRINEADTAVARLTGELQAAKSLLVESEEKRRELEGELAKATAPKARGGR